MNKFTRDEVFDISLRYFNGDELAANVWINKYALKDSEGNIYEQSPDDMHRRLAKELARIEAKYPNPLSEDEIYELIKKFKYIIPQGGPMSGIGNNLQTVSLSNCFVIGNDSDSYGGLMLTDQQQVQLMKRRGGVGHDLSHIRPKGSPVKNSALTSTGVVPFMERFSNSTREVAQDGRRGALMLSLSIKHPDSEAFIDAKMESGKVTGANVSVKIDDEFMRSVVNNKSYIQQYPIDSLNPKIRKEIDAQKLWKKIIHNAWKSAEPGILFWDNIINESIPDCYTDFGYKTVSTNPCQPKWARVLTPNGIRTIGDITIGDTIWSNDGWTTVVNKWSTGIKKVYKYETTFNTFYGTENHRVVSDGQKVEVKDATHIDLLRGNIATDIKFDEKIIMDGLVIGDGSVHKASNNLVYLCVGKDDSDYFNSEVKDLILEKRDGIKPNVAYEIQTNVTHDELPLTFNRTIPSRYLYGDKNVVCSFLRGLYSANGSVVSDRITLKSASKELIEQVRMMLSSIGIASYYTTNKPKMVRFENGEYLCKESYDLNITRDKELFSKIVGFIQNYKTEKLHYIIDNKSNKKEVIKKKIIKTIVINEEEVFDITVNNESHTYWTEGCNVSNCGEIPLCPYDSCRLVSLNLYSYVVNPFTKDAYFDFELFKKHVMYAQRLMDDIVDLELEKIEQILTKIDSDIEPEHIKQVERELWLNIKRMAIDGRRTGTGITAEGDMLAALGLRYGTPEATLFATNIHKHIAAYAYKSSIVMADERGAFKVWSEELEKNNPFLNRVHDALKEFGETDVLELYKTAGRRNIALLTIAPAGTTSLMTQTTSGIEPVFLPVYNRRRKVNPNDKNVKVSFVDEVGDAFEEYNVFHDKFKVWAEVNGYDIDSLTSMKPEDLEQVVEKSPYYKATSNDVDWVEKVRMQGSIQQYVDHSISVTVNLPNDISEEVVAKVYQTGWEYGCKGITIYRDGSRNGVLVSTTKKDEKAIKHIIKENNAPKRPKDLNCDVIRFVNGGVKWIGFIGLLGEAPYEIFTGLAESFDVPTYVDKGVIVRNKFPDENGVMVSRYDFVYKDKDGFKTTKEGLNRSFNPQYYNIAKMTSAVLRHGMPIPSAINLIDSLLFDGDLISTWKAGVKRMLKRYIVDGTVYNKKCPNCGENSLVYEGGCVICKNCGDSKCG